jgi:hypothetical protein
MTLKKKKKGTRPLIDTPNPRGERMEGMQQVLHTIERLEICLKIPLLMMHDA